MDDKKISIWLLRKTGIRLRRIRIVVYCISNYSFTINAGYSVFFFIKQLGHRMIDSRPQ